MAGGRGNLSVVFRSPLSALLFLQQVADFFAQIVAVPAMFLGLGEHAPLSRVWQTGYGGMCRPGKIWPSVTRWDPPGDRSIAADHLGREGSTTYGGKFFAK